jgi:hypothetical protein
MCCIEANSINSVATSNFYEILYLLGMEHGVNRPRHVNRISSMSTKHTLCSYSRSKKSKFTRVTKQEQELTDLLMPVEVEPIQRTAGINRITPSSSLEVGGGHSLTYPFASAT